MTTLEFAIRLKKGMRVVNNPLGAGVITKIDRKGTVWMRLDEDGIEGTVATGSLRLERKES